MHNTHFFLTNETDPSDALAHVQSYLESRHEEGGDGAIDGADYFTVETAINLLNGQAAAEGADLDPKFHTTSGVLNFFAGTFFNKENIQKRLDGYIQQIKDGLEQQCYYHCEYGGKCAEIQKEKMEVANKGPITLERMVHDASVEAGAYKFTEVGLTRLATGDCPCLVLVDFHS